MKGLEKHFDTFNKNQLETIRFGCPNQYLILKSGEKGPIYSMQWKGYIYRKTGHKSVMKVLSSPASFSHSLLPTQLSSAVPSELL